MPRCFKNRQGLKTKKGAHGAPYATILKDNTPQSSEKYTILSPLNPLPSREGRFSFPPLPIGVYGFFVILSGAKDLDLKNRFFGRYAPSE